MRSADRFAASRTRSSSARVAPWSAALLLAILGACDDKKPASKPEKPVLQEEPPGADPRVPTVFLLEPGAEPRQTLRLKLDDDNTEKLVIRMTISEVSDGKTPSPKVVMTPHFEIRPTGARSGDRQAFDWAVLEYKTEDGPGVPAQVVSGLRAQLKLLVGTTGSGTINSRAITTNTIVDVPPNTERYVAKMMEGMRDAVATMTAPLPAEDVGVGARWKVKQRMTQNGLTSDFEVTYSITKIDGDLVSMKTDLATTGVPGPIKNSMMPAQATVHLDSMSGRGQGTIILDLSTIAPKKATMSMTSEIQTTTTSMGQVHKAQSRTVLVVEKTRQ